MPLHFATAEFDRRKAQALAAMAESGLDALLSPPLMAGNGTQPTGLDQPGPLVLNILPSHGPDEARHASAQRPSAAQYL